VTVKNITLITKTARVTELVISNKQVVRTRRLAIDRGSAAIGLFRQTITAVIPLQIKLRERPA
jgi:sporulation protein YlmC with PRC-barrel domain